MIIEPDKELSVPLWLRQLVNWIRDYCSRTRKDPAGPTPRGTTFIDLSTHDLEETRLPKEIIVPISTYLQHMRATMTKRQWRRWRGKARAAARSTDPHAGRSYTQDQLAE